MKVKNPLDLSWKTEWPSWLILAAAIASSFYFYARFPDIVVTHWNFHGQPDGYMPKAFGAFIFPALLAFMYLMLILSPYLDPKRDRYADFKKVYNIFRNLILAVMALLFFVTGLYNLGWNINIGVITAAAVGVLMMVLGNYMGKIKNNWFMGIRTPWTMSSENVWNKTHRLGGAIFMVWGFCLIFAPFMPEDAALAVLLGGIAALLAATTVYSYILYRREKN